jgi:hypothetical protein
MQCTRWQGQGVKARTERPLDRRRRGLELAVVVAAAARCGRRLRLYALRREPPQRALQICAAERRAVALAAATIALKQRVERLE